MNSFTHYFPTMAKNYRVLDLGCGNGVLSELVFHKLPDSYVVGFDLTELMLQEFENNLSKYSGRFELIQGDFNRDAIGNDYDIIIAGLTLHHLTCEQRGNFYKKLYTALNEGGY